MSAPRALPYSARPSFRPTHSSRFTVLHRKSFLAATLLAVATLVPTSPARAEDTDAGTAAAPAPAIATPGAADGGMEAPKAESPGSERIVEIRLEGNRRVETEVIKRALRQKLGDLFDPNLTREDIKRLWDLGYFTDIQLLTQHLPNGIAYVVRVVERPTIHEIKLEGLEELSKEDLFKDVIDLKPFSILDLDAVRRNAKKIQDKYVEKGFFLAEVTHRIVPVKAGAQVDVVFVINEHAKVLVKQIHLIGASKVDPAELKALMITKEGTYLSWLTSEGTYREEAFQRDLAVIEAAYYDRGFINVKVEKPSVSLSADKRNIFISVKIEEGEPYRVSKIDFAGDLLVPKAALRAVVTSEEGDFFSRAKILHDDGALGDIYQDQGYAYANFNPETIVDPPNRAVSLTFRIEKGKQQTIERIDVIGNAKTRDRVIRRELRVYEGELFSGTGIKHSKERVTALGFFETVEVTFKPGRDDSHVVVLVEVKEKATGTFQVGFGFSSVESFILTAQVSQNNFVGWGSTVALSAQISSLRQLYQISYFDPYIFDTNYLLSVDLFRTQIDQFDFTRQAAGGTLGVGHYILPDENLSATVGYTLEYVVVEPGGTGTGTALGAFNSSILPLANRFRNGHTSSVRLSLNWDKRDNRLFPSKGFLQFAQVEYAPSFLGGNFNFAKYSLNSRFYVPFPLGIVFKTNLAVGYIAELDANKPLPISEQFLLGGINTVRGFSLNSISPTALVGSRTAPDAAVGPFVIGGNKELIFNLELEFPIVPKAGLKGVLFYDAGNAFAATSNFFEDPQNHLPLGLFHSVGFGVRWFSPVGPLRFEWGIPLTRRPQDDGILFEFTIGNAF